MTDMKYIVTIVVKNKQLIVEKHFDSEAEIAEYIRAAVLIYGPYLTIEMGRELPASARETDD